ncbi:hypothetical protein PHISP_00068 [Aspergillus sp. HF37]|nr:hypothetical protein PHISP_00068 [Aspergillus sp. HF37]
MPLFNVTLKSEAPQEELERAKEHAQNNGGIIRHEYSLIKGFTYAATSPCSLPSPASLTAATPAAIGPADTESLSVEYPDDQVQVLESTEHLHVEQDGEMRTQS